MVLKPTNSFDGFETNELSKPESGGVRFSFEDSRRARARAREEKPGDRSYSTTVLWRSCTNQVGWELWIVTLIKAGVSLAGSCFSVMALEPQAAHQGRLLSLRLPNEPDEEEVQTNPDSASSCLVECVLLCFWTRNRGKVDLHSMVPAHQILWILHVH